LLRPLYNKERERERERERETAGVRIAPHFIPLTPAVFIKLSRERERERERERGRDISKFV
jgi:hypothetical protein